MIGPFRKKLKKVCGGICGFTPELNHARQQLLDAQNEHAVKVREMENTAASLEQQIAMLHNAHSAKIREMEDATASLEHQIAVLQNTQEATIKSICRKMKELDFIAAGHHDSLLTIPFFTGQILNNLEDVLEEAGAERIEGEASFDFHRHQTEGGSRARTGAAIAETVRPGFSLHQKVYRPAVVRLSENM